MIDRVKNILRISVRLILLTMIYSFVFVITAFGIGSCGVDDCYFKETSISIGSYLFALPSYIYWCVFTFTKKKPLADKPLLSKLLALGLPLYILIFIIGFVLDQIIK
jgi:hypothetical protein